MELFKILPMFGYLLLISIIAAIAYLFVKAIYFDVIKYRYKVVSKIDGKVYYQTNNEDDAEFCVRYCNDKFPDDEVIIEENEDLSGDLNLTT